jgi:hypothetical protein
LYSKTGNRSTDQWKTLIGGLLPMIFSYLNAPILDNLENKLSGSEKFKKALAMVEKYLAKYVNTSVAQEDVIGFIQANYDKWIGDKFERPTKITEKVFMDDVEITLFEAI